MEQGNWSIFQLETCTEKQCAHTISNGVMRTFDPILLDELGAVQACACAEFKVREAVKAIEFEVDPSLLVHPCCTVSSIGRAWTGPYVIF